MQKKIVILNGSPRKNGNTALLADAFTAGAERAGHTVARFDLGQMDVHPCIGCLHGGRDGKQSPCTQKDDMDRIYCAFWDADVLVLASPLYYWTITAQLKGAIDRLFAVHEANNYKTLKLECALLAVAGDAGESNFRPVTDYFNSLCGNLGWRMAGMVLAGGVTRIGDIEGNPALGEAEALGASL